MKNPPQYNGENPVDNDYAAAEDEIDLKQIFSTVYRYKWVLLACILISGVAAWIYAESLTPIYQSEGTIIIKDSQRGMGMQGSDLENLVASAYGVGMGSTIANELEVIKSRRLSREVADKLIQHRNQPDGLLYPILIPDELTDESIADLETVAFRIRENLVTSRVNRESDVVQIKFESPSPYEAASIVNLIIETYAGLSTSENREMARSALEFLNTEMDQTQQVLQDSEESLRDFMNREGLVELDRQTEELVGTIARLEGELQGILIRQTAVQSGLENYRRELDSIRPGLAEQFADGIAPRLERYQFRLAELETERHLMLARNPGLENRPESEPTLVNLNRQIDRLRTEIRELATGLAANEQYLGFLGSADGNVAQRVGQLREQLLLLEVEDSQYEAQARMLRERTGQYQQDFDRMPDNMIQLARLKRTLQMNEQLYMAIARQSSEMALWEQTQTGLGRVVDHAVEPIRPISPRKPIIWLLGLMLGTSVALGYVFIREMTSSEINSVEKLKKTGLSVLAVIPDMQSIINEEFQGKEYYSVRGVSVSTNLMMLLDPISPVAESIRRLHNNLIYSQPDIPLKTILITSSNKGEGKSTVSSNLAVAMAEAGKKVLLIDCDFRRNRVHRVLGLSEGPGITELLFGETTKAEAIRETIIPNVFALTTGKKPPNAAALSRSQKLRSLILEMKEEFDHVIIDSPPYGIITDAGPLIQLSDAVAIVVRFNETSQSELDQSLENLRNIRANVVGSILLGYDHKKSSGYYYTDNYYKNAYKRYYEYTDKG